MKKPGAILRPSHTHSLDIKALIVTINACWNFLGAGEHTDAVGWTATTLFPYHSRIEPSQSMSLQSQVPCLKRVRTRLRTS